MLARRGGNPLLFVVVQLAAPVTATLSVSSLRFVLKTPVTRFPAFSVHHHRVPRFTLPSNQRYNPSVLAFRVANRRLQRISKPLPRLRPNWALLRVRMAGICNTDIEILRGYHAFCRIPGHEFVGEVADLNSRSPSLSKKWL